MNINFNNTICEHDMDLLFAQLFSKNRTFLSLFLDKPYFDYSLVDVQVSKTTVDGETDIYLLLEKDGLRHAIFIEDKIDASETSEQRQRYTIRADKEVQSGEIDTYTIFMICPKKYLFNHELIKPDGSQYPNYITYERIIEVLMLSHESEFAIKQIQSAIDNSKTSRPTVINDSANQFLREYLAYQQSHYPELHCTTSPNVNGWWLHYRIRDTRMYIYHKPNNGEFFGSVDLTINGSAGNEAHAKHLVSLLQEVGIHNVIEVQTGKSMALRILVPKMDNTQPFSSYSESDKREVFEAILLLYKIADFYLTFEDLITQ